MAIRFPERMGSGTACPKCGERLLAIEGSLTRWLTCPKCKYKKLESKTKKELSPLNVRSIR